MTDKEIIRELEQKLSNKRKECDELQKTIKSQKEELKILNYTLYEERNLTTDLAKANLKISALKRDLNSVKDRFKHENQQNKEIIKAKEQECEELKKELQAQRAFTTHEQKLVYCVAYDETCKTGNDCKQEKCIFKGNIKLKQVLAEIEEIAKNMNTSCFYDDFDCKDYNMKNGCIFLSRLKILQKIKECGVKNE